MSRLLLKKRPAHLKLLRLNKKQNKKRLTIARRETWVQGIRRRSEIPCFPRLRGRLRQSRPIAVQLFPFRTTSEAGKDGSGRQEGFFSPLRPTLTTALVQGGTRDLSPQRPYQAPSQGACGHLDAVFRSVLSLCTGGWTHAGNIKSRRCSQP